MIEFTGWKVDQVAEVVEEPSDNFSTHLIGGPAWKRDEQCLRLSKAVLNTPEGIPEAYLNTITAMSAAVPGNDRLQEYNEWKQIMMDNWQFIIDGGSLSHLSYRSFPIAFGMMSKLLVRTISSF